MDFALGGKYLEVEARAREAAEKIVAPRAKDADAEGRFYPDVIDALAQRGLLALVLPREMGGEGMDNLALTLLYEEIGRVDSSVRGFLSVQIGLVTQCLLDHGSRAQKVRWLPLLGNGSAIGCYCLTEPQAGSDAGSITATAHRDGNDWVLNGCKHWITNGNVADVAIVFATVDASAGRKGVTAFIVPTDAPGFSASPMSGTELGHRGSDHARIVLNDVRVDGDGLLGVPGDGFGIAMGALDHGRLGVAAGAVGILQACLDACTDFARSRRQFGKRIGDFQMIQQVLADTVADTSAARLLTRRAAWLRDEGLSNTSAVSVAKLFATEAAARAAGQAVLLHGSRGYSNEYPVERYYRDVKGLQIYEGTSHIQRIIIARDILGKEDATGSEVAGGPVTD